MKLVAVSVSHRHASLADLERLALSADGWEAAIPSLLALDGVLEVVPLGTCNRVEVYAWAEDPERAGVDILAWLERTGGFEPGELRDLAEILLAEPALHHLFEVTAGLWSMIPGEPEIQGQVRTAYRRASALGAVGPHLHRMFAWTLRSGRQARNTAGLDRAGSSLPGAALRALDVALDGVDGRQVVVVGAGKVGTSCAWALTDREALAGVCVRDFSSVCEGLDAPMLPLASLLEVLTEVDGAVFATAAPQPLLSAEDLVEVAARRRGRPLAVVDLGMPRNVDPTAASLNGQLPGVALFDIDRLDHGGFTEVEGLSERMARAAEAVDAEAERCAAWFRAIPADAVAAAIQGMADRVARVEADRALRRLPGLDPKEQATIEAAIRRSIRKIVHHPTVRTRDAGAHGDRALLEAARWLFALDAESEDAPGPPGRGVA